MKHPERVQDYLEHILDAIERATEYTRELQSLEALEQDRQIQDAIVRNITVIGEAANRLHKAAPELVARHSAVPWNQMRGMRNRLIHDYFDVEWPTVWDTVKNDLPLLKRQIEALLAQLQGDRSSQ